MKPTAGLLVFLLILQSCDKPKTKSIEKVAKFTFRNSYAGHETMTMPELDSMALLDPEMIASDTKDKTILQNLEKAGFISGGRLLLEQTDFPVANDNNTDTTYAFCRIFYDKKAKSRMLEVKSGGKKIKHKLPSEAPYVKYHATDIIPGGDKEIIVLDSYYVMNGDNYDLDVYQVK